MESTKKILALIDDGYFSQLASLCKKGVMYFPTKQISDFFKDGESSRMLELMFNESLIKEDIQKAFGVFFKKYDILLEDYILDYEKEEVTLLFKYKLDYQNYKITVSLRS